MEILAVPFFILLALFLLPCVYVILQYNGLITLQNRIQESWSNVDTELKRRHDLIPNLVAVVQGYAKHEQSLFTQIAELRSQARSTEDVAQRSTCEQALGNGLTRLFAVVENYPTLRADTQFLNVQKELVITEDRIQAARRFYNGNVRDYRNKCQSFPGNLVANAFRFKPEPFFEADPACRLAPVAGFATS
jgi:LemA protein